MEHDRVKHGKHILIGMIVAIVAGVGLWLALAWPVFAPQVPGSPSAAPQASSSSTGAAAHIDVSKLPPITPAEQQLLKTSHGFSVLISYTGGDFQPADTTVARGATVRFTNNGAGALKLCGEGVFSSCRTIESRGFWEYTFTAAGTFSYRDASGHSGVVRVK